jgi:predicted amidophosphoribosyltransferase
VIERLLDSIEGIDPRPAGFGGCGRCPWRERSSAAVCHRCAAGELPDRIGLRCAVCDQRLAAAGICLNGWCRREGRQFSAVWAIAAHTDQMRRALRSYKIDGNRRWALVFGRLLAGFLDDHLPWFEEYDLIVGAPAYVGPGARRAWDHIAEVMRIAAEVGTGIWPFETGRSPVVVRTAEAARMSGRSAVDRRSHAERELRKTLLVPEPDRVAGLRLLVFDDVFTEGSTLREVARVLRRAGATEVAGVVLARQPWAAP